MVAQTGNASDARIAPGLPAHAYGLDLIRIVAALMVAVFHFTWTSPQLSWLLPVGWIGVPVFFVLSGLVIANSAWNATPRDFLVKRFLRLYPAGWICAIISILIIWLAWDAIDRGGIGGELTAARIAASFLLFGNAFVVSAYWSLPLELVFYGLVLLVVATRGSSGILPLGRCLILWSGLFLSLRLIGETGLISVDQLDLGFGLRNATLLRHGHYFGLGIILFALARDRTTRLHLPWIAVATVLAIIETAWRADHFLARQGRIHDVLPVTIVCLAVWSVLCVGMVASLRGVGQGTLAPLARPIRALGLATYPFYLVHEAVGGAVIGTLISWQTPSGLRVVAALTMALVVALAVSELVEPRLRVMLRGRLLRPRIA